MPTLWWHIAKVLPSGAIEREAFCQGGRRTEAFGRAGFEFPVRLGASLERPLGRVLCLLRAMPEDRPISQGKPPQRDARHRRRVLAATQQLVRLLLSQLLFEQGGGS